MYFFIFRLFWIFIPVQAFSRCTVQRLPFVVVHGLLIMVISLVEHRLLGAWASVAALGLQSMGFSSCGSWAFSCSTACGIFPDRGLNLYPLSWQVDSYLLYHQGSPRDGYDQNLIWGKHISPRIWLFCFRSAFKSLASCRILASDKIYCSEKQSQAEYFSLTTNRPASPVGISNLGEFSLEGTRQPRTVFASLGSQHIERDN